MGLNFVTFILIIICGIDGFQGSDMLNPAASGLGICNQYSKLNIGGVGAEGQISSPFYPNFTTSNHCDLDIMTCPECVVQLRFDVIDFPKCTKPAPTSITYQWCIDGCDHFYLHEQYYRLQTSFVVMNYGNGTNRQTYTSLSNRLYLRLCHDAANDNVASRFRITYKVIRKSWSFEGTAINGENIGYFSSPAFPENYAKHGEVYEYQVKTLDTTGAILLTFPDWDLSSTSKVTIHKKNGNNVIVYGNSSRPVLLSTEFRVLFEPGNMTWEWPPDMGFNAKFQFLNKSTSFRLVNTDCGKYMKQQQGGEFLWNTHSCWPIHYVDCVWVIHKYQDIYGTTGNMVSIRFITTILAVSDTLEIRAGVHSRAPLIGIFNYKNLTRHEFSSANGIYLRLRATCEIWKALRTVFVTYANASDDGICNYYMKKCRNNRCIPSNLWCDDQHVDHCGDNSDEDRNVCEAATTVISCAPFYYCTNISQRYCPEQRCDGIPHCTDASDERNCKSKEDDDDDDDDDDDESYHWSYYVPIGMICVLVAFATCFLITCCLRRKKRLRLAAQRRQARGAQLSSVSGQVNPDGQRSGTRLSISVEIEHYDAPPTYEEAMNFNPFAGATNMGYMPDSIFYAQPPPYSTTPSNLQPISFGPLVGGGNIGNQSGTNSNTRQQHRHDDDNNMDNNNTGVQDQNDWNRNLNEDLNGNTNMATANVTTPGGIIGVAYGNANVANSNQNTGTTVNSDTTTAATNPSDNTARNSTNSEDSASSIQRLFSNPNSELLRSNSGNPNATDSARTSENSEDSTSTLQRLFNAANTAAQARNSANSDNSLSGSLRLVSSSNRESVESTDSTSNEEGKSESADKPICETPKVENKLESSEFTASAGEKKELLPADESNASLAVTKETENEQMGFENKAFESDSSPSSTESLPTVSASHVVENGVKKAQDEGQTFRLAEEPSSTQSSTV